MAADQITDTPPILELHSGGNTLSIDERDGHFNLDIENPWAGDTETGLGAETHISLDRDGAERLANWLYARLGQAQ